MRPDIDLASFESEGLTQQNRKAAVSALVEHFKQGEAAQQSDATVNTGGGAYFGGDVSAGGDVVGRDKHVNDNSTNVSAGRDMNIGDRTEHHYGSSGGSDSNVVIFSVVLFAIFAIIALVVLVLLSRGAMP
jgi:hypothetical protein